MMIKSYRFFILLLLTAFATAPPAKACVDYHPTPPPITVKVDSSFIKFEITVHQLSIFAGSTGDFCTCALANYQQLFDYIYYVAFVDSGTINPVNGFDVWNGNSTASSEWNTASPNYQWNGFVAAVINNMTPNTPVELIIKADLPPGIVSITDFDSTLTYSAFGTDEWDNNNNTLAFSHNSISGFGPATYHIVPISYFTSQEELENNFSIKIFPNPSKGKFYITSSNIPQNSEIEIYNILGIKINYFEISSNKLALDLGGLSNGVYFVKVKKDKDILLTQKIIISNN